MFRICTGPRSLKSNNQHFYKAQVQVARRNAGQRSREVVRWRRRTNFLLLSRPRGELTMLKTLPWNDSRFLLVRSEQNRQASTNLDLFLYV